MGTSLPPIPAKRYFTIGEVAELCDVKTHVLRYWEQEFSQLRPMKRKGNRRYYQHHEVLMIRSIRELLYDQGFTISGARNRLLSLENGSAMSPSENIPVVINVSAHSLFTGMVPTARASVVQVEQPAAMPQPAAPVARTMDLRRKLLEIRKLLEDE